MANRTVITGIGVVSSSGIGFDEFSKAFLNKNNCTIAQNNYKLATVKEFSIEKYLPTPKAYLDRSSQFLLAATSLAIGNAKLSTIPPETALVIGTQYGPLETEEIFYRDVIEKGPKFAKPFLFPHCYSNTGISLTAIEYNLKGTHVNIASGMTAGAEALTCAFHLIRSGRASIAIAGGYDVISPLLIKNLELTGLLNNNSFLPGEGAGIFIIENYDQAIKRNAPIKAEILDTRMATKIESAMEIAKDRNINLICLSANGMAEIDNAEQKTISKYLNAQTKTLTYSPKKIIGETFAAGGPLNLAAAICLLTANFKNYPVAALINSINETIDSVCILISLDHFS